MVSRVTASKSAQVTFGILIVGSICLLAAILYPVWKPVFMAAVLAAAISPANEWFARKLGNRRRVATAVTTILVIAVLVIPLVVLGVVIVGEAIDAFRFVRATLEAGGIAGLVERLPDSIEDPLREVLVVLPADVEGLADGGIGGRAAGLLSSVLTGATAMAFNLGIMLIAFHSLLGNGRVLVAWILRVSPLPETGELLSEARQVSGFVLRSSFLTALIQGVVATIGYLIASVPNPLFFGMITFVAAFIPSVGTGLICFPLVGLLILSGLTWQPIFLGVWAIVAVGLVDNLVKPWLIKDGVHLDGVLIFLSLIGGLLVFGGIGLLIGPLALTFFLAMVRFGYRVYLEQPIRTIITPGTE